MDEAFRDELTRIYAQTKTIAVIGASTKPGRPAHDVPEYLHGQGYRILPITPRPGVILDEKTSASLAELTEVPDVVEVFRPREEAETVARAAIAAGVKILWFQPETETPEAIRLAEAAGVRVIWGRCMRTTHQELRLGPVAR
jgi:predicted CoA-binding protein